jgi:hypothetical protein
VADNTIAGRVHYHIIHIIPDPRLHGLNGYLEVIETIRWGLESLGHRVTVAMNSGDPGAVNIVFGWQLLNDAAMRAFPPNTILYNLEQIATVPTDQMWPTFRYAAQHLRIWEYSRTNLAAWKALHPACKVKLVPIGYAPTLSRIGKREEEIDVLFYGLPSDMRLAVFRDLCLAGLRAVFVCGLYGRARDEMIARAKVVLNLNLYPGRVFEVVRVSYLLANSKAVVSNLYADSDIEPDMRQAVEFVPTDQIVPTCVRLVNDRGARHALERRGLNAIRSRDIRSILRDIVGETERGRE